jgi:hypothetical protein
MRAEPGSGLDLSAGLFRANHLEFVAQSMALADTDNHL